MDELFEMEGQRVGRDIQLIGEERSMTLIQLNESLWRAAA